MSLHLLRRGRLLTPVASAAAIALGATWLALNMTLPATGQAPVFGWRAGDPDTVVVEVSDSTLRAVTVAAGRLLDDLNIRASRISSSRLIDNFRQKTVDTSIALDEDGKPVATITFDAITGELWSVVNHGHTAGELSGALDPEQLPAMAKSLLHEADISAPPSSPTVSWDQGMEAWQVFWPRTVAGCAVPADFTAVWIYPGGQVRAISHVETPLDPEPLTTVPSEQAQEAVRVFFSRSQVGAKAISLGAPILEWRQPNDFVDPSFPAAPAVHARLVWSVTYSIQLSWGERAQGVFWIDAATGSIVGGSDVS